MEPRYRGALVVIARSFARIHETNLKKQGIVPLTFVNSASYDDIGEDDRISVLGLSALAPGSDVRCLITKPDGRRGEFLGRHTFSEEQLTWFAAGSALNAIRNIVAGIVRQRLKRFVYLDGTIHGTFQQRRLRHTHGLYADRGLSLLFALRKRKQAQEFFEMLQPICPAPTLEPNGEG